MAHVIKFLNFLIAVLDLSQSLLSQTTYSFLSYAPSLIFPKKFLIAKLVRSVRLESSNPRESILLFSVLFGCHPKMLVFVLSFCLACLCVHHQALILPYGVILGAAHGTFAH